MVADIFICIGVGILVTAVIIYKIKDARKNRGCSCCSECKGDCKNKKLGKQDE